MQIYSWTLSDVGGIHLTNPAFLPTALLKELSATEDQFYSGNICNENEAMSQ